MIMSIAKGRTVIGCCWLLAAIISSSADAEGYSVTATPNWVVAVDVPYDDWVETSPGSNGVAYLLVDRQWSMVDARQRNYNHFITKALSASGVEEVSEISIDFDPLYEQLILHGISVRRDGVVMDRLDSSRIDLMQREKELEYRLYNGSLTLNVILEDIRPGDTVEYSYTIEGGNPIFNGRFSKDLNLQWTVPVGRVHYRLIWPQLVSLYFQKHETTITPIKRSFGKVTEYIWQRDKVEARASDGNAPSWYDPVPRVSISDINSWDEVVAWALPLYRNAPLTKSEKELVAALIEGSATQEQRILAALRFVQEQIRYLGLEMGESSHKPSLPGEVLDRRYGDCKDKTRLLISLLREMGIEAYPALVNTASGDNLPQALPTLRAFNHVIALVKLDGNNYWLDPTRIYQAGDLATIYQPDYDYALVVAETDGGLRNMSDDIKVVHSKQVSETIDITQSPEQPVVYRIETEFNRYYADSLREQLAESDLNSLQQSYLNYTARYYPSVEIDNDIQVVMANERNSIKLIESYLIPGAWKPQKDSNYVMMNFEPFLIDDHISAVESPRRRAPYAVTHPVSYQQTTRIITPPGSQFEKEHHEINDSAFRFVKSVEFADGELVIKYLYESLRDHVKAIDIEQHAANLRQVYNLSSYQVRMLDPSIEFGVYRFDIQDINWVMVGVAVLTLALTILLSYKLIYFYNPPVRILEEIDSNLSGLTGWLILPGISICLTPFVVLWGMQELMYVFSAVQWSAMGEDFGAGMLTLAACEVIVNIITVVVSLFLIVMFVTKRRGVPKLFIGFYLFMVVTLGADTLALYLLSIPGIEPEAEDIGQLVRAIFYALIWGSYFAVSKRVKATFTQDINGKQRLPGEPAVQNS